MPRIGLVSPYALDVPGGVQDQVLGLANQLTARGIEAIVVGPADDGAGIGRITRISANGAVAPVSLSPSAWRKVRSALSGVDVIHIHEPFMPVVSWAALSIDTATTVVTFHADPPPSVRRAYRVLRPRWALRNVHAVTAVSNTAANAITGWAESVTIIPNAVRSIPAAGAKNPKQVAFLGRDDPRKGLSVLLEAWPSIVARHPEAQLVVVGAVRPTQANVRFLGRVDEAAKDQVLAQSTIFCAPNLGGESFGITVAEAMSAGCAIVASDLPAFRDLLGTAGTFVPVGDTVVLAAAISAALDRPDLTKSSGSEAQILAASFRWDVVTDRYLDIYQMNSAK